MPIVVPFCCCCCGLRPPLLPCDPAGDLFPKPFTFPSRPPFGEAGVDGLPREDVFDHDLMNVDEGSSASSRSLVGAQERPRLRSSERPLTPDLWPACSLLGVEGVDCEYRGVSGEAEIGGGSGGDGEGVEKLDIDIDFGEGTGTGERSPPPGPPRNGEGATRIVWLALEDDITGFWPTETTPRCTFSDVSRCSRPRVLSLLERLGPSAARAPDVPSVGDSMVFSNENKPWCSVPPVRRGL